jgi:hypothetical protein
VDPRNPGMEYTFSSGALFPKAIISVASFTHHNLLYLFRPRKYQIKDAAQHLQKIKDYRWYRYTLETIPLNNNRQFWEEFFLPEETK